jgi:glycosyltransferase involved in cell wall biosynthesis
LLVVGDGTYEAELRRQAANNPRIRFLGRYSPPQLGAVYYHALACVVPSLTYETFGLVCLEAFARKTPVIVRDLGGLPEVVRDSGGGLIYRTNEELVDALRRVTLVPGLRAELGENGYRGLLRWWTREAHLKRYFEVLRKTALRKLERVPWEEPEKEGVPYSAGSKRGVCACPPMTSTS